MPRRSKDDFIQEVRSLFERQTSIECLLSLSERLQAEFKEHLVTSPQCMLPSFNYTLPTGQEQGTYLALEVGGSNLRMALVELRGRSRGPESIRIRQTRLWAIDSQIRQLKDLKFFDWMAAKIAELLLLEKRSLDNTGSVEPLRMGVAWSFPIDQTSIRSGNVLGMGKGFCCSDLIKGQDLGNIITQACKRAKINISLDAIVNDSSAALLARAYIDPTTRLSIILGTGMNAAIHLPIASLHPSKFGSRSLPEVHSAVTHVLTNTELSMFGGKVFPTTRWDQHLNTNHILPNYQPFEYLVSGGYMGEIVRLILVEATTVIGLFNSHLPPPLATPYSLDTKTLAAIESDTSPSSKISHTTLHPSPSPHHPISQTDTTLIREIIHSVSNRSIAFFTAGIHALASLLDDTESESESESKAGIHVQTNQHLDHLCIGCDGSVINKYTGYMDGAQELLDRMREVEGRGRKRKRVVLEKTWESAVVGAGVAVAVAAAAKGSKL